MQAFQERYVLLVDTSEIDSARSDISETVNEFVRRPGSGRRKTHIPWRSPWDASVCTVFASLPSACSPMKQAPTASGATAAVTTAGMDCLTPCSGAPTPVSGVRRGKGKQELCGPCCHCGATSSPQWRKGPKGKPILCNACGIRFLRTRSLGKVTPKKRRSPVGGSVVHSAAAKRLKLDDEDTEDGDEGRTSSGAEYALDEAPPPEAETEEPTDEIQEDLVALHSSLQAAAAAVKLEAATAAAAALPARPAASAVAGMPAGSHDDEATGGGQAAALATALKQQQQQVLLQALLQQQLQRAGAAQQHPLLAAPLAMLAGANPSMLGFVGQLSPQLLKREGQGSAPSSPLVAPLPAPPGASAAGVPLGGLDASLRLLLSGMLPGSALAAAGGAQEDAAGVVVQLQRARSKGPATSGRTA